MKRNNPPQQIGQRVTQFVETAERIGPTTAIEIFRASGLDVSWNQAKAAYRLAHKGCVAGLMKRLTDKTPLIYAVTPDWRDEVEKRKPKGSRKNPAATIDVCENLDSIPAIARRMGPLFTAWNSIERVQNDG